MFNNGYENPYPNEHTMKYVDVNHSEQCCKILNSIGLMKKDEDNGKWIIKESCLQAVKHYPPSCAGDGKISPCNGRLFAATRSSQNLQFCTGYLVSRYLAKYVAGVDEHNRVRVGIASQQQTDLELQMEMLGNMKITSSIIKDKEKQKKSRDFNHQTKGRAIGLMEVVSLILGYPQVYTDIRFIHVSTLPLEQRPAFDKTSKLSNLKKEGIIHPNTIIQNPRDLDERSVIPSHLQQDKMFRARILPKWRQHTSTELLILRDQIMSTVLMDSGTIFACRPPELRFIREQKCYFCWFVRNAKSGLCTTHEAKERFQFGLKSDYVKSRWIDGTNCDIHLRASALPELIQYLSTLTDTDFECQPNDQSPRTVREQLFCDMHSLLQSEHLPTFSYRNQIKLEMYETLFLDRSALEQKLPIIWFNSIRPN